MLTRFILCFVTCLFCGQALAHDVFVLRNVNLRAEPNTASEVLKTLKPGNDAKLLDREMSGGYFRVLHRVGVGFVWSRNV